MKRVSVCIPVLRRYDLLRELLWSLHVSTIKPIGIYIINNGRDQGRLHKALLSANAPVFVETPAENLGVAASWNKFILDTEDDRVIVNDDVTFAPDSLELLTASTADLVWAAGFGFSCFVIRDSCIEKLGLFDDTISPGYGYYEDEDYLQRLDGRGTLPPNAIAENVECHIKHTHSATLKAASHTELLEHHRKFKIAQSNYARKCKIEDQFL